MGRIDLELTLFPAPSSSDALEDFEGAFKRAYKSEFGFLLESKAIVVDDVKVRNIFYLSYFCPSFSGGRISLLSSLRGLLLRMMFVLSKPLLTRPPPHQVRGIGSSFDDLGENVHDEVRRLRTEGKTSGVSKERANGTHSVHFEEVSG